MAVHPASRHPATCCSSCLSSRVVNPPEEHTPMKTWFITGTSSGFGRAWAIAALERGDQVVATALDAADLNDLADRFGDSVLPVTLDSEAQAAVDASASSAGKQLLVVPRLDGVYGGVGVLATL